MTQHITEAELRQILETLSSLFDKIQVVDGDFEENICALDEDFRIYSHPLLLKTPVGSRQIKLGFTLQSPLINGLQEALYRDDLTGVYNRRYLNDLRFLKKGEDIPQRMGMLLMDLRRFKKINDTWGHIAGDGILMQVAAKLNACLVGEEAVIRFGGDEFVVLEPGCSEKYIQQRMEQFRQAVEQIMPADFGYAWTDTFRGDQHMLLQLIDIADRRMYAEKATIED